MDDNRTSITRVHDALLGGTDNYPADRAVRDRLLAIDPDFPGAAQEVRAFARRVVHYLTRDAGITQLLDCGLFLPIAANSHAVAQQINPDSTVVYASVDPFVLAHARALLAGNDHAHVTEVNISHADRVLADPVVREYLDLSRPVGLLHVLSLQHFPDHDDPWLTMAQYVGALAPGSYVVLAHMLHPGPGHELAATIDQVGEVYRTGIGTGWPRSAERILDFLSGLQLLEPGLVPVGDWRPDSPFPGVPGPIRRLIVGAVARKP
jgi:S-adenosyl methyltransferase